MLAKQLKVKAKNKKQDLLGTFGAYLLWDLLTGKGTIRAGEGTIRVGQYFNAASSFN